MSAGTFTYRCRTDTAENLARSLIVAATATPPGGVLHLPMTAEGAMHLGRALEWAVRQEAVHAARVAELERTQADLMAAQAVATAEADAALEVLDRAVRLNWQSVWTLVVAVVSMTAALVFWIMARGVA